MKAIIKDTFKQILADRYLFILLTFMILISIIFATIIAFSIHPSELQLVSHYSAFGITHRYRDQWFYLYVFVVFQILIAFLHTVISAKLFLVKGRAYGIVYAWLTIGILTFGFSIALAVLRIWTPL